MNQKLKPVISDCVTGLFCVITLLQLFVGTPAPGATAPDRPAVRIMRPKPKQLFYDTPILIQVFVTNFKLEAPKNFFGTTDDQTIGHIHYTLDNFPLVATAETQLMLGKNAHKKPLPAGEHVLTVELVKTNHKSLSPKVITKVKFLTDHGTKGKPAVPSDEG